MHKCNICIRIHNNELNLNELNILLRQFINEITESNSLVDKVFILTTDNLNSDTEQLIKNLNLKYQLIKLKSNLIEEISVEYDNDLPMFYIESGYKLEINLKNVNWEEINTPIFIKEYCGNYLYHKLFYLPYYTIKNETSIELINLVNGNQADNILEGCIKNVNSSNTLSEFIKKFSNSHVNKLFSKVINTEYDDLLKNDYTNFIDKNTCNNIKWIIHYFYGISYYHNQNFKKSRNHLNICIALCNNKYEPYYFLAKMLYENETYAKANQILNKTNIKCNSNIILSNPPICNFHIEYLKLLINFKLKNISETLTLANLLIHSECCLPNYKNEIAEYIINLQDSKNNDINQTILSKSKIFLNNTYGESVNYKVVTKTDILTDIEQKDNILTIKQNNDTLFNIDLISNSKCSCILHKNDKLIIATSLSPFTLKILKDNLPTKLLEYNTGSYLSNYEFVTKFVKYNNVYISLLSFKNVDNNKLYKLFMINNNNLKPINTSDLFNINIGHIKDIFVIDDYLLVIGKNSHTFISLCDMYFDNNLDIDYIPEIILDKHTDIGVSIECAEYNIVDKFYKNFNLECDSSKHNIKIDLTNNIITNKNTGFTKLIQDFIYLPYNINVAEKISDVTFFSNNTDIILKNYFEEKGVTNSNNFRTSKYLIITTFDLENLTSQELSDIIINKTLIITLLEEEEVNNTTNVKYKTNSELNKLFIFNIVKNEEYKEFIFNKIIQDDQYQIRSEYFDIDINNIYQSANIFETIIKFIDTEETFNRKLELNNTKNNYKVDLINRLHSKTENTGVLEVLKYIIINDQNITIFTENEEVDELIYKLNILGDICSLSDVDTETFIGTKCIIILENYNNLKEWGHLYDSDSLIYITSDQKIIYCPSTNS